jgi:hypothetical protein
MTYPNTSSRVLIDVWQEMAYFTNFTDEASSFIFFYGHKTGRVIASIFEIFEPLVEKWFWVIFANSGDDSAHSFELLPGHYIIDFRNSRVFLKKGSLVLQKAFYILACMSPKKISILLIDDDQ